MRNEEIVHKVNQILAEEFEVEEASLQPTATLKDVLDLDSLDYVDLVVLLESNFAMKVKQEDFTTIRTFSDLYSYIATKTAQPALA